jgi:arabinogalactan endo-1,4-beta-galactosidase
MLLPELSRGQAADFVKGADVGWLPQMEASGYQFSDRNGEKEDCLAILKQYGINTIRLRVFVNPSQNPRSGHCRRDEVVAMAERASKQGFRILIDFHYSDSWADPGKQTKPKAWAHHDINQLKEDVYHHTQDVLLALGKRGVTPEWVQIGNEIPNGMLWPEGSAKNTADLVALINEGYRAVKEINPRIKVIVHLDKGWNGPLYRWFFDRFFANGGKCDVIGMSYYASALLPDSEKMIHSLGVNLREMASRYPVEVMVVETGELSTEPLKSREKLTAVIQAVRSVPDHKGLGVIYWEPEGVTSWSHYKMNCWNENGRPTEALNAFQEN